MRTDQPRGTADCESDGLTASIILRNALEAYLRNIHVDRSTISRLPE